MVEEAVTPIASVLNRSYLLAPRLNHPRLADAIVRSGMGAIRLVGALREIHAYVVEVSAWAVPVLPHVFRPKARLLKDTGGMLAGLQLDDADPRNLAEAVQTFLSEEAANPLTLPRPRHHTHVSTAAGAFGIRKNPPQPTTSPACSTTK